MKKTTTWKTDSGLTVTATCEIVKEKTLNADGYKTTVPCCEKHFSISVEKMGIVGCGINRYPRTAKNGVTYPATCGRLAISRENLEAIDKMIAEVESDPDWIKKQDRIRKAEKAESEYHKHYQAVCDAMAE